MVGGVFDYLRGLYDIVVGVVVVEDCYDYFIVGVNVFKFVENVGWDVENIVGF